MKVKSIFLIALMTVFIGCCTVNNYAGSNPNFKSEQQKIYDCIDKNIDAVVTVMVTTIDIQCDDVYDSSTCKIVDKKKFGTGWIIDAKKGLIVTNEHVTSMGVEFVVTTSKKKKIYDVKLVKSFENEDVTLLKADLSDVNVKEVKLAKDYRVGQKVIVIGHPFALWNSISQGIVSAIRSFEGKNAKYVQFDASINSGNSGGPVFDLNGNVIAMSTFGIGPRHGGSVGTNFGVSAETINNLLGEYFK